jgi:hypothetical protein
MAALSLQDWLSLISTIAIVLALVFAGVQVREANRARRDQAAVAAVHRGRRAARSDHELVHRDRDARAADRLQPPAQQVAAGGGAPGVARQVERPHQVVTSGRLQEREEAEAGGGAVERPPLAQLRAVADALRALHLVHVDQLRVLRRQHRHEGGLAGLAGEGLQDRVGGLDQVRRGGHPALARGEPARPRRVASGLAAGRVAAPHQGAQQREQAGLGRAEGLGQLGQARPARAGGEPLQDVERPGHRPVPARPLRPPRRGA